MKKPTGSQEVPRDIYGNRSLQALAKKHGIKIETLTQYNGYGREIFGRKVVDEDYPKWRELILKQREQIAAKEAKRNAVLPDAVSGTKYAQIAVGLDPSNPELFERGFFERFIREFGMRDIKVVFQRIRNGRVQVSASHLVTFSNKAVSITHHMDLGLPAFVHRLAHAKSPAKCVNNWSRKLLQELQSILNEVERLTANLPGAELLTADERNQLVLENGELRSTDPEALYAGIVPAAKNRFEEKLARELPAKHKEFADYLHCFPLARNQRRRIIALLGPTNSGKTWEAVRGLIAARRGVYLGPLRLLALEQQEFIEDSGVPCSLITGEERLLRSETHSSRTIEMADFTRWVDVAVIDEFQMVHDLDRGPAWVAALCGIGASEVILTGSPAALPAIEVLAKLCGDELEIRQLERKGTLDMMPVVELTTLPKRSAVVCFSRDMVIEVCGLFQSQGIRCSAVYGDLSPEVRREEARRFRDGETDVVVATDAIGMGLNLPIEQLAFWETDKYDGKKDRPLRVAEIHQIAGRAGRGLDGCGRVTAFSLRDHQRITKALVRSVPPVPAETLGAAPSSFHLETIARELGENRLAILLAFFIERARFDNEIFRPTVSDQARELARLLDNISVEPPVTARFAWLHAPVDTRDKASMKDFTYWYGAFCASRPCLAPAVPISSPDIDVLENCYRRLRLYRWLGQRFAERFVGVDLVSQQIHQLNVRMQGFLRNKPGLRDGRRKECSCCGRALLPSSRYSDCRACHEEEL